MKQLSLIEHRLYTMCMVQDGNRVLLLNRPNHKGFPGYIAPGGKVDFPESIVNGAIREVREETGLIVNRIEYKGLDEFCDPSSGVRGMVFNYLATSVEGDLLQDPPEGELLWIERDKALELPMQEWFRQRFPLFFQPGTFERSSVRSNDGLQGSKTTLSYGPEGAVVATASGHPR